MAAIRELRRLFEAISKKDWESAQSVAEQLAASQAKRGNRSAARVLRDSLHQNKNGVVTNYASVLELGLTKRNSSAKLRDVVLPKQLRSELQAIINEFRHAQELEAHGLMVRKKLIFTGP